MVPPKIMLYFVKVFLHFPKNVTLKWIGTLIMVFHCSRHFDRHERTKQEMNAWAERTSHTVVLLEAGLGSQTRFPSIGMHLPHWFFPRKEADDLKKITTVSRWQQTTKQIYKFWIVIFHASWNDVTHFLHWLQWKEMNSIHHHLPRLSPRQWCQRLVFTGNTVQSLLL